MYMNCWIHCCTSALLRSQIFRLVLPSFARNSWALGGGMPTEDLDGAVLAPATWEGRGWGHVRATNKIKQCNPRIYIQISSSGDCLLPLVSWHLVFLLPASKMFHKESRLSPSLLLRILCRLLVPDTSVRDSRQTAHHMSPPLTVCRHSCAFSGKEWNWWLWRYSLLLGVEARPRHSAGDSSGLIFTQSSSTQHSALRLMSKNSCALLFHFPPHAAS